MDVLLVSATSFEIEETINWLRSRSTGDNVSAVKWLIGGIGQLQTTYALTRETAINRPALLLQAGIAGSSNATDIGQTFAIRSDRIADLGVLDQAGFTDIFGLGLDNADRFPFNAGRLPNPCEALLRWTGLPL